MAIEQTFSIIKPDAVERNLIGDILKMITDSGLRIKGMKMIHMDRAKAEGFYAVHKERPFFGELVDYMISGPVVVSCLEGENAIENYRKLMGATNPANAEKGTIRAAFGLDIQNNSCHGSDGSETARTEVAYFFNKNELVG
ncbi:MAG: nucleoside-diphosphate kinase [Pseudodesulfovibrio sp.]|uniref:Nucleoside diphosphate kinase n=1 Tax=Pseudodesulfovibrio aespoeensis (strain ATCC 700646 / DSM 10631 / Aspo-2) TaxID=643562 RepID=E6VWM1_PSEA9|nr:MULTISPECIES: nucleoside-diphosphate kinase [Pseudodesulfovibrio]MBU4190952.1 nucleoside-diphosphate kinase [Pseudomonadota bacterium]ADU62522.1 Nucleoside-diphosphate kinase [Pseudodesulfovibrio aespoeensis Aspo-2]MBU4242723.1 nucleoside-diphosphate kinase [Pseudomonadota bacterium]MBU4377816.1 nucleoside-diphosphate kinase [Pseudomonadota bacterium]MBU4473876.1 nucleoside-diphosphate kinase [Pseudomonadota bacterium]